MKVFKKRLYALFLISLMAVAAGCGDLFEKKDINQPNDLVSQYIGVAAASPDLKILVSYLSPYNSLFTINQFARLKLVDEADYSANSTAYQYLGRAYAGPNSGDNFVVPMHEYFIPLGTPNESTFGFHYQLSRCIQGYTCPALAAVPNPNPIAYVNSYEDYSKAVVPLYQYALPGNIGSSGSAGNTAFTLDPSIIAGIEQATGVRVKWGVIGFIFHGTQADCDANPVRSPYCGSKLY